MDIHDHDQSWHESCTLPMQGQRMRAVGGQGRGTKSLGNAVFENEYAIHQQRPKWGGKGRQQAAGTCLAAGNALPRG